MSSMYIPQYTFEYTIFHVYSEVAFLRRRILGREGPTDRIHYILVYFDNILRRRGFPKRA